MALTDNILAYWKLDNDGSGGVSVVDSTGNSYTLTNYGTILGDGIINNGAQWSTPQSVDSTTWFENDSINITTDFSVSYWVKPSTFSDQSFIVPLCLGGGASSERILLFIKPDGIAWWLFAGGADTLNLSVNFNVWNHICIVGDSTAGTVIFYVNGVASSPVTITQNASYSNIYLGVANDQAYTSGSFVLEGNLDEVGLWTRKLTSNEVTSLYNNGSGRAYPFTPALTDNIRAYWKFDETSGTRYDSVSNLQITETNGTIGSSSGIINAAANITNGDSAWLTLPPGVCDVGSGQKTFSFWFYLTQTGVGYQWIGPMQGTGGDYAELNVAYIEAAGQLECIFTTSNGSWTNYLSYTPYSIPPTTGVWHHAVAVFDGSTCTLYYDGQYANQQAYLGPIASSNGSYTLGEYDAYNPSSSIGGTPFNGRVDELGIWDRALTAGEVAALYNNGRGLTYPFTSPTTNAFLKIKPTAPSAPTTLANNILAYWKLDDDGSGNVSLVDSTGNTNSLTNNNNVTLGPGKIRGCAAFNGSNYLANSNIRVSGNYSISLWVKPSSQSTSFPTVICLDAINNTGSLYINDIIAPNGFRYFNAAFNNSITLDTWNHFVLSYSSGITSIYLNGSLMGTDSGVVSLQSVISLGTTDNGYIDICWFNGLIDEVGIWNRSLTSDDVAALYNNGSGKTYPFMPGSFLKINSTTASSSLINNIQAYWKLDNDGSDNVSLLDSTGNGYALTNNGSVTLGTGIIAGDAVFNGSGKLTLPSLASQSTATWTISQWIRLDQVSTGNYQVFTGSTPTLGMQAYIRPDGNIEVALYGNSPIGYNTNTALPDTNWHHIVVTGDSDGTVIVYLDSNQIFTNTTAGDVVPITNNAGSTFGQQNDGPWPITGQMDEIGIWSRVLTPAEITTLYNNGIGKTYPFTASTNAFFRIRSV